MAIPLNTHQNKEQPETKADPLRKDTQQYKYFENPQLSSPEQQARNI